MTLSMTGVKGIMRKSLDDAVLEMNQKLSIYLDHNGYFKIYRKFIREILPD